MQKVLFPSHFPSIRITPLGQEDKVSILVLNHPQRNHHHPYHLLIPFSTSFPSTHGLQQVTLIFPSRFEVETGTTIPRFGNLHFYHITTMHQRVWLGLVPTSLLNHHATTGTHHFHNPQCGETTSYLSQHATHNKPSEAFLS